MQIAIVLYPGSSALDYVGPYEVLRWLPGADVRFVWHEVGPVTADSGVFVAGATHTFDETPHPTVIVVPGGFTTMQQARDTALLTWLRNADLTASWTTSVCSGSVVLAAAGLLNGRRATSHWATVALLRAFGAVPVSDERVVAERSADGTHIVTCAGVSAGIDLALWLAAEIGGEERARAIQLAMEYDPHPPFDSGHVSKASPRTRAAATALMATDLIRPAEVRAASSVLWCAALDGARSRTPRVAGIIRRLTCRVRPHAAGAPHRLR